MPPDYLRNFSVGINDDQAITSGGSTEGWYGG